MKEFKQMCKKVAQQTNDNEHTGAKLTVAKFFKMQKFIAIFEAVEKMHDYDGSLLPDVSAIRTRFGKIMMQELQNKLSEEQFFKLDKSF